MQSGKRLCPYGFGIRKKKDFGRKKDRRCKKLTKTKEKSNLFKFLAYDLLAFNEGKFCSKGRCLRHSKHSAIS